jgi:carbon storage regulator
VLVLSRKQGECVQIGEEIEVAVLEVRGNRVRLGFSAPPSVSIHRGEIHARIEEWLPAQELA